MLAKAYPPQIHDSLINQIPVKSDSLKQEIMLLDSSIPSIKLNTQANPIISTVEKKINDKKTDFKSTEMLVEDTLSKKETHFSVPQSTKNLPKEKNTAKINSRQSLFTNHSLKAEDLNPKIYPLSNLYWISGILLIIFMLYVWLKVVNEKKLKQIINTFLTNRALKSFREEHALSSRLSIFLLVIHVLVLSLFIYQLDSFYHWGLSYQSGFLFYINLCGIIVLIYFIKIGIVKLLGLIFKIQNAASEYVFTIFLFNKITGLFLLPIVICITFLKQVTPLYFINLGLLLIASMLIYRSLRGFIITLNDSKISKFYLFVYLCTLEILPVIVLMKAIISKNLMFN